MTRQPIFGTKSNTTGRFTGIVMDAAYNTMMLMNGLIPLDSLPADRIDKALRLFRYLNHADRREGYLLNAANCLCVASETGLDAAEVDDAAEDLSLAGMADYYASADRHNGGPFGVALCYCVKPQPFSVVCTVDHILRLFDRCWPKLSELVAMLPDASEADVLAALDCLMRRRLVSIEMIDGTETLVPH